MEPVPKKEEAQAVDQAYPPVGHRYPAEVPRWCGSPAIHPLPKLPSLSVDPDLVHLMGRPSVVSLQETDLLRIETTSLEVACEQDGSPRPFEWRRGRRVIDIRRQKIRKSSATARQMDGAR
jgi:hypothetical protein